MITLSKRDVEVATGALKVALIVKRQQASQFTLAEASNAEERLDNDRRQQIAVQDAKSLENVIDQLNIGGEGRAASASPSQPHGSQGGES